VRAVLRRSDVFNATRTFLAKFLQQIKEGNPPVPVDILVQAKAKEPPSDALPKFVEAYTSFKRVGTLVKESSSGKLMTEWEQAVSKSDQKPELVDMAPALSALMAVKDEEEMVCSNFVSGVKVF
jgi:nucleosome binding factor SPN SPT16 subunit